MTVYIAKRSEKTGEGSGLNVGSFERFKLYSLDENSAETKAYVQNGLLVALTETVSQAALDELVNKGLLR